MKHRSATSPEITGKSPAQCKLTVGAVNDPLEHEADAMAEKVMRMPESNLVQRKCAHCEEEEKVQRKPLASFIQKKGSAGGTPVNDTISKQINSNKGTGGVIDTTTRSYMENRFGADFSQVKIHTDHEAIQMSHDLAAKAFTVGNDIYFNKNEYAPGSEDGKHLLAHELTHTLQQSETIQRDPQVNIDEHSAGVALPIGDWVITGRLDEPLNLVTDITGRPVNLPLSSLHLGVSYLDHCATGAMRGFRAELRSQQAAGRGVFDLKAADKGGRLTFELVIAGRRISAGADVTVPADPASGAPTFFLVARDNGKADNTLPTDCIPGPAEQDSLDDTDGGGGNGHTIPPPRRIGCTSIDCEAGPTVENFLRYHECCRGGPPRKPTTPELTKRTVYFYYDTPYFKEKSSDDIIRLFDLMRMVPSLHIMITGHTSMEGTEEHNEKLSRERAEAVRNYLVMRRIDSSRIQLFWMGEYAPAVAEPAEPLKGTLRSPGSEAIRDLNRRAEITFFDPAGSFGLPAFAPLKLTVPDLSLKVPGTFGRRSFLDSQLQTP